MDLDKASKIKFATCGINQKNAEYYLRKNGYSKLRFGNEKNSTYMIMTNRVTLDKDTYINLKISLIVLTSFLEKMFSKLNEMA